MRKELVVEYIKKFPTTPNLTLARLIYKENKNLFNNVEAVRSYIRTVKGKNGTINKVYAVAEVKQDADGLKNPFDILPDGMKSFDDWEPVLVDGTNVLVLSDIHIPYHNSEALNAAIKYGKSKKVDTVILNGDIADFYSVSHFIRDPRKVNFEHELEVLKLFLIEIRLAFPKARIIYKVGNHEERFEIYCKVKAPELFGMGWTTYSNITGADLLDIEIVKDKRIIKIGKLNVIHGHEFGKMVFDPVNPARGFYQRGKECCLGGHLHRTSEHVETSMNGQVIGCWSTGCLCDVRPEYAPMNKWNLGFSIVTQNEKGFRVHNHKIIDGEVY
jgi:predicted phosphodiesterase